MNRNKKVSEDIIKKVVKEWIQREKKIHETNLSCSSDHGIDCPNCNGFRMVSFYCGRGWSCQNIDCLFIFPKHLKPPNPDQLQTYWNKEELKKRIEMFLEKK
ncbi:hypothetical protein KKA23_01400 [Patescibacteria group bacterium]|nr:hypothetical protein [Patescibacteria group bacterium]MBU3923004.1 hypothetical protein [Patescibacteria group bacterium]